MRRLLVITTLTVACAPNGSTPPAPVKTKNAASESQHKESPSARPPCENSADTDLLVDLARAALSSRDPSLGLLCPIAEPVCDTDTTSNGQSCRIAAQFEDRGDPDRSYTIVNLWPKAANGGLVHLRYSVDGALAKATLPHQLPKNRWATAGDLSCRGESSKRSYGIKQRALVGTVRATCWNRGAQPVTLRVTSVQLELSGGTTRPATLEGSVSLTLKPGGSKPLVVAIKRFEVPLKSTSAFGISIAADPGSLSPVFEFNALLRIPLRR